jgi:hypothetical protein
MRADQHPPLTGRFFQTNMGSGLVPVGAGVVMGWVGTLVVALVAFYHQTKGDRKGPHATSLPLPPLRGRWAFSSKNYP